MPPPPTFDVRLAGGRMLSPQVRELVFERVDGATFEFEAGQWVSLVLPLAEGEARSASLPSNKSSVGVPDSAFAGMSGVRSRL